MSSIISISIRIPRWTKPATQKTRRPAEVEAEALIQEAADTRAFTEATPGYVENRSLLTELERARMRLED